MKGKFFTGTLFLMFVCQQCSPPVPSASTASNRPLKETYWRLSEVYGKSVPSDTIQRRPAHLIFREAENRVVGNGGCNSISGTYVLSESNRITLSRMISTKMACPDLDVETQFLNALQAVDTYRINGDTLILTKSNTDILAKLFYTQQP